MFDIIFATNWKDEKSAIFKIPQGVDMVLNKQNKVNL